MASADQKKRKWRSDDPKPTQPILDRQPPCDVSAEIAVLGSILLMPDVCDELALVLKPEDFYDDANRKLYEHMIGMVEMGLKIDVTLLVNRLKTAEDYEAVGGSAYLAKLANSVPNAAHAVYYAKIVQQKSTLRKLIEASTSILRDAYDEAVDPKELLGRVPALMVSLEMSGVELADRLLCSVARVNGHKLRTGNLSQEERQRLVRKAYEVSNAPLYVDDAPSRTVSEIAAVARRIKQREKRLGLIVVDYLQLIEPDNSKDPRQEQVAKIARRLKGLAREQQVPVLCLSQLNRQSEDGKDHRPKMSQLRESGAIEQDADVVMFVHREEYYHRGDDAAQYAGQAELIIAKQRNGPVGDIELTWEKDFTRFSDRAPERHSEFDNYNSNFQSPGNF